MSIRYVVHTCSALLGESPAQKQICTRCGAVLFDQTGARAAQGIPATFPWTAGDRVALREDGAVSLPHRIDAGQDLVDDEVECGGAVDVGRRLDA